MKTIFDTMGKILSGERASGPAWSAAGGASGAAILFARISALSPSPPYTANFRALKNGELEFSSVAQ